MYSPLTIGAGVMKISLLLGKKYLGAAIVITM